MTARRRSSRPKKPKRVAYELLPPDNAAYKLLSRLVSEHHRELIGASIMLAWCSSWRADVDGRQTLGQCKKASDLDRELATHDFVILLQRDFWTNPAVEDMQRRALLDHELCHATVKLDPNTLEPQEDERGRKVFRVRKHDLEEFAEIAQRYGCWKKDLENFAQALQRAEVQPELPLRSEQATAPRTH
jgi:hypothetical protein